MKNAELYSQVLLSDDRFLQKLMRLVGGQARQILLNMSAGDEFTSYILTLQLKPNKCSAALTATVLNCPQAFIRSQTPA